MVDGRCGFSRCQNEESNIEVEMRRLVSSFGDAMDVEVNSRFDQMQAGEAGFFLRLPKGHPPQIAVAVSMAARLEPSIQLPVVDEQDLVSPGVEDQSRSGQVAFQARAMQGVRMVGTELEDLLFDQVILGLSRPYLVDGGRKISSC